jgi:hypothetical protein
MQVAAELHGIKEAYLWGYYVITSFSFTAMVFYL